VAKLTKSTGDQIIISPTVGPKIKAKVLTFLFFFSSPHHTPFVEHLFSTCCVGNKPEA